MSRVTASPLPMDALLNRYNKLSWGNPGEPYTDSFAIRTDRPVDISQFVFAFYTTKLFKLERVILKYLVAKPSTDAQAELLANGAIESFAAWSVEARSYDQLLMCDFRGRTRSWFMVEPNRADTGHSSTLLRFGSAVVPIKDAKTGLMGLGPGFNVLLGVHRLYSRALLSAASRRLGRLAG